MNDPREPKRNDGITPLSSGATEEQLVADPRGSLSPSQQVDRKLMTVLQRSPILVSRLNSPRLVRR